MRNRLKLLLLLLTITLIHTSKSVADNITLAADVWCPYNCEQDALEQGFMVEIAQTAFKNAGHTLEYKVIPWARALEDTRGGKYDGVVGAYKEDAPDFIFPKTPITKSAISFFAKNSSNWRYQSIKDLQHISLGAILDYSYGEELDQYIQSKKDDKLSVQLISGGNALEINIKKLLSDRVQVLVEDKKVLAYFAKKNNYSQLIKEVGTLGEEEVYIAFSPKLKKSQEYANILSEYVKKISTSGEINKILAKYGAS